MIRLAALAATEARLLVRDWTVLVFAFVFPPFVMLDPRGRLRQPAGRGLRDDNGPTTTTSRPRSGCRSSRWR